MAEKLTPRQQFETPSEALAHYGVKGMRWGHRKNEAPAPEYESTVDPKALESPIARMDKKVHTKSQDAAYEISGLLKERYGYEVAEVKSIPQSRSTKGYIAYVESDAKKNNSRGTIFVQPDDQSERLAKAEKAGWFGPGCGNMRAIMTHETAHSMFHAEETLEGGLFRGKVVGGNKAARDKAWSAAVAAAKADGIKERNMRKKISGYSNSSLWQEETEAELFSRYHWSGDSNPRFIKVWGETLHKELGVDATPFREVVDNG